ncbi:MAG: GDSL-type esterase/lipase family protein [Prevotellaceae bacterium]|nr:GDSL-type esterase/lipase family protein [Prevotellaceae bacterium]
MLLVIASLASLCVFFPEDGIAFFRVRLFFPTFKELFVREESHFSVEKMQELEESLRIQHLEDSLHDVRTAARNDSLRFYQNLFATHPARFYLPNDDLTFFDSLFVSLENCRRDSSIVHILHYGDSQIEEDRITGYLRQQLQVRFGGIGAGLLPVIQPIPSAAIGQTATEDMQRFIIAGLHRNSAGHNRYGILGQMARVNGSGRVSFSARNYGRTFENTKRWKTVRLFVNNNVGKFSATLSATNYRATQTIENGQKTPSVLTWNLGDSVKNVSISLSGNAELSGVALDGDLGVAIDNIPIRGSTGTHFTAIDTTAFAFAMRELNVKLILLEFGGNMMTGISSEKQIERYVGNLAKQIQHFQQIKPDAKIVLIGPADMSKKVRGKLQTYPYLDVLVEAMKTTAMDNGAAFWDMYGVMGGHNSMLDWVDSKPSLAAPDYIHFTPRGANRIAKILYESFENYYEYYKLTRE